MKRIEIIANGKVYPCSPTMGAMMRFRDMTGREITEIDGGSLSDLCTYLYCCVVSAAKREGKPFDVSLMDFADSIDPEDMRKWNEAMQAEGTGDAEGEDGQKKSL